MAKTIELQQVICPSCRQVINSFSPFEALVECPYCHNKAFNPLITAKKVPVPERIITFTTSEADFEKEMVRQLIETDYTPTDIFSAISPGNVIRAYMPMFLFEGKYSSTWTCSVGRSKDGGPVVKDGKVTLTKSNLQYEPYSGNTEGNFAILCLACQGTDMPEELRKFTSFLPYNAVDSQPYDPDLLTTTDGSAQPITIAPDADAQSIWAKHGNEKVNEAVRRDVLKYVAGMDVKDFNAINSYDLRHEGKYVLAPFWFVYYTYDNERYFFIMDGQGAVSSIATPVNEDEKRYVKRKKRWKTFINRLWIIALVVVYMATFKDAFITLIVWAIVALFANVIIKIQIKKRLKRSKQLRREASQSL